MRQAFASDAWRKYIETDMKRFPITISVEGHDWNFQSDVLAFQAETPQKLVDQFSKRTRKQLLKGIAVGFIQNVAESSHAHARKTAVEFSQILIPIRYSEFIQKLPAANWGTRLDHYLGGETAVPVSRRNEPGHDEARRDRL
ncbi:MAG: hypothetical protein A2X94_00290 [Bdellovibrionales bacterium GWB1_55_8]|nr:MAG: hypothetical protein A2X94_00290 [Bdellovibrionales bacterium GWB1_55_8]